MKVFVGLSGGVDSSVSAALLKEAGHEVVGVFLRVWQPDFLPCSWRDDRTDAKRVCATLGIPFLEIDCSTEYKQDVADYMIREYKQGRTPNPDVMCNAKIKFGIFYEKARAMGAGIVATGHYAQVKEIGGEMHLLKGADAQKDQSYFLWGIQKEQLQHIRFPIGHLQKGEVRALAEKYGLHTATKKDSQGLCFLGKLDMHNFLSHFIESKRGDVLDTGGNVIGHHDGAIFLTLGQRHGFTITKKTPDDSPYYVIAKDVTRNTIMVSNLPTIERAMPKTQTVTLSHTNWLDAIDTVKTYTARLRYRQQLFPLRIIDTDAGNATANVTVIEPQLFVPAGQSLVVYDGECCVGGGVIEEMWGMQ